ncbi:peptidylprolyl isomerase, partial [Pseudomonas sp. GP01-A4]
MAELPETLTLTLDTGNGEGGDVVIKLRGDLAPNHVARIADLA